MPVDREERESVLLKNARKAEKILVECDEEFFECEDTLDEMIYQFIINNKESFLD